MDEQVKNRLENIRNSGLRIEDLAKIIGRNPVFLAAALTGNAQLTETDEEALYNAGVNADLKLCRNPPLRVSSSELQNDPFLYRLQEMMKVYGLPLKLLVNEKLGDGILSAIDCKVDVQTRKEGDADRVTVSFDCKFLPYKPW